MKLAAFIFSLSIFLFVLFSYLFIDPNFFYLKGIYTGFAFSNRLTVTVIYLLFILVLFGFYILFLKKNYLSNFLLGGIVLISLFSYPAMLSADIFNYLTTAKVTFTYYENPYVVMPIEFLGDSNLLFTHAANKLALYGPLWIGLTGVPYFLGFGNFLLTLFNFKILASLFYLATVWLIKKISKSNISAVFFALNPLVIIEIFVGGHNDIVMMFFALFSFFFLKEKRIILACLFLVSSILIKYATIFLIPVFLFVAYKTFKKEYINWNNIYLYSFLSMLAIFLLSALRVEIYPWYAIWFLTFASVIAQKRILFYTSLAFSFGLLLRYIPFMLFGTHFGIAPMFKTVATFTPVILVIIYAYFKKSFR